MIFWISLSVLLIFTAAGLIFPLPFCAFINLCFQFIIQYLGWFYLGSVLLILFFSIVISLSKYGKIKLGKDGEAPEYSRLTWFAMLFSAGMGIGLVFWGVAEPVSHYITPPAGITPASEMSLAMAFQFSFLHWGFHPWAIYAVTGMGLAYSVFRKNRPFLISSILAPVCKGKVRKGLGAFVDVVAILVTVFGVAASLGMGALQISSGFESIFKTPNTVLVQIIIVLVITIIYIADASSGINRGIKYLSNINIVLAVVLFLYLLFAGPASFIIKIFFTTLAGYIKNILPMSLAITPYHDDKWLGNWTIFYWAWWIAWAPFVGTFIARISKGRSIREYVLGVLVLPAAFCLAWFAVFGGTALHLELGGVEISKSAAANISTVIFTVFSSLPFGIAASYLTILLLITFFITSADSAVYVIAMFSQRGCLNPKRRFVVIAGVMVSLTAVIFLYAGGLSAMQTTSIVMSLPFAFILLLICFALFKELRVDLLGKR